VNDTKMYTVIQTCNRDLQNGSIVLQSDDGRLAFHRILKSHMSRLQYQQ